MSGDVSSAAQDSEVGHHCRKRSTDLCRIQDSTRAVTGVIEQMSRTLLEQMLSQTLSWEPRSRATPNSTSILSLVPLAKTSEPSTSQTSNKLGLDDSHPGLRIPRTLHYATTSPRMPRLSRNSLRRSCLVILGTAANGLRRKWGFLSESRIASTWSLQSMRRFSTSA